MPMKIKSDLGVCLKKGRESSFIYIFFSHGLLPSVMFAALESVRVSKRRITLVNGVKWFELINCIKLLFTIKSLFIESTAVID